MKTRKFTTLTSMTIAVALVATPALAGKHGSGSNSMSHSLRTATPLKVAQFNANTNILANSSKRTLNANLLGQNNSFKKLHVNGTLLGNGNTPIHNGVFNPGNVIGKKPWLVGPNTPPLIDPGKGNGNPSGPSGPSKKGCKPNWWWPLFYGYPYCYGNYYCGPRYICPPVYGTTIYQTDLELIDVRQIDQGDVAQNLGPAYRITFRNKSGRSVAQSFNVALAASIGRKPTADSAFASVRVDGLQAGQTLSVDMRLPERANRLGVNAAGQSVPFSWLTAVVDNDQEVQQTSRDNDVALLGRNEIVMVAMK